MEKIIFATSNSGKMREIREIMQDLGVEILSMKEAGDQSCLHPQTSTTKFLNICVPSSLWNTSGWN